MLHRAHSQATAALLSAGHDLSDPGPRLAFLALKSRYRCGLEDEPLFAFSMNPRSMAQGISTMNQAR
jgi:hypothetical protein